MILAIIVVGVFGSRDSQNPGIGQLRDPGTEKGQSRDPGFGIGIECLKLFIKKKVKILQIFKNIFYVKKNLSKKLKIKL